MKISGLIRRIGHIFRPFRDDEVETGDGGPIEELWVPDRLDPRSGRFAEERGPTWEAVWREGRLDLELSKAGLLAWAADDSRNYDDFYAEATLSFPPGEAYVAAGLAFRRASDDDFYLLLLSSRGYVRLDVVFNGKPRPVIGWTELPSRLETPRASASIGLLAQGSRFTVYVDGEWAAEAEDDTNRVGAIAFAARTFESAGTEPLRFSLTSVLVESRKIEVEALRRRFASVREAEDDSRRRLAETFVATGNHLAAAVQMDKIAKRRPLEADELLLKAEIDLRLGLLDEAAAALDASLALEPGREESILEKANLLYRRSLFPELRDFIRGLPEALARNSRMALLLGHALSNLGDWRGAATAYSEAADREPGEPLIRSNAARAFEMAEETEAAAAAWHAAGKGFFALEEADELALAEAALLRLDGPGPRLDAIRARSRFLAGKNEEALALAEAVLAADGDDPVPAYLAGLLRARSGERRLAASHFDRACSLAPDEALFAWRRAENLSLLGETAEARRLVEEALVIHPDDGWTLNLAARLDLDLLEENSDQGADLATPIAERARSRLGAAARALPGEKAPLFNLAELLSLQGRIEEALALLAPFDDDPEAHNLAGNFRTRAGSAALASDDEDGAEREFLSAEREYRRAVALDPERSDFRENLAALLVESGRWSDAEIEVGKALEKGPGPRSYLVAGNLAELFGDWPRAEAAYRVGLEAYPGDRGLLLGLGRFRILRREWDKARDCAEKLGAVSPASAERLRAEILAASTESLCCDSCGREWRLPRDLPAQSAENIRGMPPDEAPAGACPSCGRIYCIGCAKEHLDGNRFTCPSCGTNLKLSDNRLRWLVRSALETDRGGSAS